MTSRAPSPGQPGNRLDPDRVVHLTEQAEKMSARDPRRIAASLAMFERLSAHWALRGEERETLLGGIPKSTWSEWRQRPDGARLKSDTRERIANLFAIDLNAHSLFAPEFADRWVRESNASFGGESPMSTMLRGKVEDVITVRRYLERVRTSSPHHSGRSEDVGAAGELLVSLLPGDALEPDEEDAVLPALRHAAAMYERLARREPVRYRAVLAAALTALADRLEENGDPDAVPLRRRAGELQHGVASESPTDVVLDAPTRASDSG